MFKCRKCGADTHFENGLCVKCWVESKQNHGILTTKDYDYHYNTIKGRIAESLIQELFLSSRFDVFHYGMENTIPGIMDLLYGIKTDVAQDIRRMPDFVIHNPRTNSFYFAEVKFRANGAFSKENIDKDYPYHNAYFIIVSRKDIKCLTYKELEEGQKITLDSANHLGNRKEFNLDKEVMKHFCGFAVKFFECV